MADIPSVPADGMVKVVIMTACADTRTPDMAIG